MFTNPGEFFNQTLFNSFFKDGNTIFKSFVLWFGEFLVSSFVKNQLTIKKAILVVRCLQIILLLPHTNAQVWIDMLNHFNHPIFRTAIVRDLIELYAHLKWYLGLCTPEKEIRLITFHFFILFSVLTHCEFSGTPCLSLISFTDSEHPDSITMSGFRILFKIPELGQLFAQVDSKEVHLRLKKLSAVQQKDNLFVWKSNFRMCNKKFGLACPVYLFKFASSKRDRD